MSEVWIRLALIGGAMGLALLATLAMRRRRQRPVGIDGAGLAPGVYLFSSSSCLECGPARSALREDLGADRLFEIRWEEEPETFRRLGVEGVPATLVVSDNGTATLFAGDPEQALSSLGPWNRGV